MLAWLFGGNDRELATKYAGRESATERKQRKEAKRTARRQATHKRTGATAADRQGQAWADSQRY